MVYHIIEGHRLRRCWCFHQQQNISTLAAVFMSNSPGSTFILAAAKYLSHKNVNRKIDHVI